MQETGRFSRYHGYRALPAKKTKVGIGYAFPQYYVWTGQWMISPDFSAGKPAGWKVRIIARLAWVELFCPDP